MAPSKQEKESARRRVPSANDRFKAGWNARLAWSTVAAVAIHVAFFAVHPSWTGAILFSRPDTAAPPPEWISLLPAPPRLPQGPGSGARASAVRDSTGRGEPSVKVSPEGPDVATLAGVPDALLDRLRGGGSPEPTIAAPEPEPPETPDSEPPDDDSIAIGGRASTAEIAAELDSTDLDLDRLSGLTPQLALMGASAWVLIRNPKEVAQFLESRYELGRLPRGEKGTVDVTLWIDRTGDVKWAEVTRSSGKPRMDEVALQVFNHVASFRPARQEGRAVPISVMFSLNFPW